MPEHFAFLDTSTFCDEVLSPFEILIVNLASTVIDVNHVPNWELIFRALALSLALNYDTLLTAS